MKAGKLDRRVTIEQLSTVTNEVGEEIETWSTLASVWASREGSGVAQRFGSSQSFAEVDAVFRTRWYPWGDTVEALTHRLTYRDRVYDIHGTEEIGRREGLFVLTKARADNEAGSA